MKILLICFSNNYDHQLSLYSLYEDLAKFGEDVYTIGIENPKVSFSFSKKNLFFNVPKRPGVTFQTFNIIRLIHIYKFVKRQKFDFVYFESLHLWNIFLFKKLKHKTIILHRIHDIVPHEGSNKMLINSFNYLIFKNVDKIVVSSNNAYQCCCKVKNNKYVNKLVYLPLGRKWGDFNPCLNTNTVLFFGRIAKYKGLNNLVNICSDCPRIFFNIVGKPINEQDVFLIDKLKKMPNVKVCDKYVNEKEMCSFFIGSDVVILPYNSATQSGVIIDSYSYSRPCIAFNVGGIAEQIIDGETGFLINNNIKEFESELIKYLNSSIDDKNNFCKNAYLFGSAHYSSKNLASKMIELLHEILKKKNDNH